MGSPLTTHVTPKPELVYAQLQHIVISVVGKTLLLSKDATPSSRVRKVHRADTSPGYVYIPPFLLADADTLPRYQPQAVVYDYSQSVAAWRSKDPQNRASCSGFFRGRCVQCVSPCFCQGTCYLGCVRSSHARPPMPAPSNSLHDEEIRQKRMLVPKDNRVLRRYHP